MKKVKNVVSYKQNNFARAHTLYGGRYKTQVTGHRSGHRAQGTGHRSQVTGHRLQGTGYRAQGTGHRS